MPEPVILMNTKGEGHGARARIFIEGEGHAAQTRNSTCIKRGRARLPEPEIICLRRGRATVPVPVNLYLRKGEGHDPEPVLIMNPSVIFM